MSVSPAPTTPGPSAEVPIDATPNATETKARGAKRTRVRPIARNETAARGEPKRDWGRFPDRRRPRTPDDEATRGMASPARPRQTTRTHPNARTIRPSTNFVVRTHLTTRTSKSHTNDTSSASSSSARRETKRPGDKCARQARSSLGRTHRSRWQALSIRGAVSTRLARPHAKATVRTGRFAGGHG